MPLLVADVTLSILWSMSKRDASHVYHEAGRAMRTEDPHSWNYIKEVGRGRPFRFYIRRASLEVEAALNEIWHSYWLLTDPLAPDAVDD